MNMNNFEIKLGVNYVVCAENMEDAMKKARRTLVDVLEENGISMSTIIHVFRRVSIEMVK